MSGPAPIADWQTDLLHKALDARGLTSMPERQQTIEGAAGHHAASLRDLTHDEAIRILTSLGQDPAAGRRTTPTWDDRDEDMWIDRSPTRPRTSARGGAA